MRSKDKFLACCVTQAASGFLVAAAKRTRWARRAGAELRAHRFAAGSVAR